MTVKQLIKKLEKFDQDLEVKTLVFDYPYKFLDPVFKIEDKELYYNFFSGLVDPKKGKKKKDFVRIY